jgi:hypothetical protein
LREMKREREWGRERGHLERAEEMATAARLEDGRRAVLRRFPPPACAAALRPACTAPPSAPRAPPAASAGDREREEGTERDAVSQGEEFSVGG